MIVDGHPCHEWSTELSVVVVMSPTIAERG